MEPRCLAMRTSGVSTFRPCVSSGCSSHSAHVRSTMCCSGRTARAQEAICLYGPRQFHSARCHMSVLTLPSSLAFFISSSFCGVWVWCAPLHTTFLSRAYSRQRMSLYLFYQVPAGLSMEQKLVDMIRATCARMLLCVSCLPRLMAVCLAAL